MSRNDHNNDVHVLAEHVCQRVEVFVTSANLFLSSSE
jgi:hypothetical protein